MLKKVNKQLLFFFFILPASSIFANGIPKTMPDDFEIHYHSYIGHNPNYREINLSLNECSVMLNDSALTIFSFTIRKEELTSLYNALFALKAFTLKSKTNEYSDRGGEKIDYTIAGKRYIVNNEGAYHIIRSHVDHFIESINLITSCADRHQH